AELGNAFDLVRPQLGGSFVTITSARGMLDSGDLHAVSAPIDSTVSRVVFSVYVDNVRSIDLRRPSGLLVAAGDPGVKITDLSTGRIFTLETPEAGAWKLEIS